MIETLIPLLEDYEDEQKQALLEFDETINKNIKMPTFKKTILRIRGYGKQTSNRSLQLYFHAIGQGLSVVHVKSHVIGLLLYDLSVLFDKDASESARRVNERISFYETFYESLANKDF